MRDVRALEVHAGGGCGAIAPSGVRCWSFDRVGKPMRPFDPFLAASSVPLRLRPDGTP